MCFVHSRHSSPSAPRCRWNAASAAHKGNTILSTVLLLWRLEHMWLHGSRGFDRVPRVLKLNVLINQGKRVAEREFLAVVSPTRDSFFLLGGVCVCVCASGGGGAAGDARGGALWRSSPCAPGVLSLPWLNGNKLTGRGSPRLIPGFEQLLRKLFGALGLTLSARLLSRRPRGARTCCPPPTRGPARPRTMSSGLRRDACGSVGQPGMLERLLAASRATLWRNELGRRPACCCQSGP